MKPQEDNIFCVIVSVTMVMVCLVISM